MSEMNIEDSTVTVTTQDGDPNVLVVEQVTTDVVVETVEFSLEVAAEGVQGPPGPAGADSTVPGPPGPPGAPGSAPQAYMHDQGAPSDTWTIVHNLGYRPNIYCEDSAGTGIMGDIDHPDLNTSVVTFAFSSGGKAYCS